MLFDRVCTYRVVMPGVLALFLLGPLVEIEAQQVVGRKATVSPLPRAHAHNDYEHERPLLDALDQGFCSVEADVHLVDGKLLVAHDLGDAQPSRTLEALYLDPLRHRIQANSGQVYPDGPPFYLWIDIKSAAEPTYEALRNVLSLYRDLLVGGSDQGNSDPNAATSGSKPKDSRLAGPVRITISGNRPFAMMEQELDPWCGVDGRLSDLESDKSAASMPMISDNWGLHFRWRGDGPLSLEERAKLHEFVAKAHQKGRKIRFWATPERESVWQELADAQVDFINTDALARLRSWALQNP